MELYENKQEELTQSNTTYDSRISKIMQAYFKQMGIKVLPIIDVECKNITENIERND